MTLESVKWVSACTLAEHGQGILSIYNEVIAHSTALYEYEPRTWADMENWFELKAQRGFPVIAAVRNDAPSQVLGFASYGTFRAYPAYQFTVEHSVYVDEAARGQGLGRALLERLIEQAKSSRYHTMIGVIDSQNSASLHLHAKMGFEKAGHLAQVGFKFDRWLDVDLYQIQLT